MTVTSGSQVSSRLKLVTKHPGGDVGLAGLVGLVGHGRPGEIQDVQGDEGGLEQPRVGLVLLDDGEHGGHAQDDAQNHVEADEELVQATIAGMDSGIVSKAEANRDQAEDVKENGGGEERPEPVLIIRSPKNTKL